MLITMNIPQAGRVSMPSEKMDLKPIVDAKLQVVQLVLKRRNLELDLHELIHTIYSEMIRQGVTYVNCETLIDDASIVKFLRTWILDE